jgi:prepilin-type N-terminal cleavage/methylation domain-containing protein
MKKVLLQKGFTLVELLIAMTIFVSFVGILIGSYTSIIKGQREADEYRIMYSESRKIFETIVQELRDGMVDYKKYNANDTGGVIGGLDTLHVVSKDASMQSSIVYDEVGGVVSIKKGKFGQDSAWEEFNLNSPDLVGVTDFKFYISPSIDPYDDENVYKDKNQLHPKVTVYGKFVRKFGNGKEYSMELQTTVSSRIYNQVY